MLKHIIRYLRIFSGFFLGLSPSDPSISIYKTLMFNLMAFGLKGVFRLPVIIYGNTRICKIGRIVLHCDMKPGLLKIGHLSSNSQGVTKFINYGTIELFNAAEILGCTTIVNTGIIKFRGYNRISDGCYVFIRSELDMGEQSGIGFHSTIMDTDFHYLIETETGNVRNNNSPITIGRYNWIGCNTFIKKGVKTPDYLIVASPNALLTKDYTTIFPQYAVVGGAPIKLLKTGVRRIFNQRHEEELNQFFSVHPDIEFTKEDGVENLDDYCRRVNEEDGKI